MNAKKSMDSGKIVGGSIFSDFVETRGIFPRVVFFSQGVRSKKYHRGCT